MDEYYRAFLEFLQLVPEDEEMNLEDLFEAFEFYRNDRYVREILDSVL